MTESSRYYTAAQKHKVLTHYRRHTHGAGFDALAARFSIAGGGPHHPALVWPVGWHPCLSPPLSSPRAPSIAHTGRDHSTYIHSHQAQQPQAGGGALHGAAPSSAAAHGESGVASICSTIWTEDTSGNKEKNPETHTSRM